MSPRCCTRRGTGSLPVFVFAIMIAFVFVSCLVLSLWLALSLRELERGKRVRRLPRLRSIAPLIRLWHPAMSDYIVL